MSDLSQAFDKIKERQGEYCRQCSKPLLECECQMAAITWPVNQSIDFSRPDHCESGV